MKTKNKTIFQLITSVTIGGAENIAFALTDYCNQKDPGLKIFVFEIHKTEDAYRQQLIQHLAEKRIEVQTLGWSNKTISLLLSPFVLLFKILRLRPAIIHAHTDLPDFVLSTTLRFLVNPTFSIVRTIHNTILWPTHHRLGKWTERKLMGDYIAAVSPAALESYRHLRSKYGLSQALHQQVIYNGLQTASPLPHPFVLAPGKINIAFAGRLEDQKGADMLIQIIQSAAATLQDRIMFHIAGDGSYRTQVEALCAGQSNCKYYGAVPQLAAKLHAFDYLLMPSRFEGLALMSIEASLAGVPVIAANVPGLAETLPPQWPLLAQEYNAEAFLQLLQQIMNEQHHHQQLAAAAFHFASTHFNHEQMGEQYLNLYHQLLN